MSSAAVFYKNGPRTSLQYLPAANVVAGQVIVLEDLTAYADLDMPPNGQDPIQQMSLYVGGNLACAADAAYPVGTRVYWNPTTNQVTASSTGTVPFGMIVGGPTYLASDGGPTGAASQCLVFHDPTGVGDTEILQIGATASDSVTNTNTETAFATTAIIPAGTLEVNDVISVRLAVEVTAQNSTNTNLVKLKISTASGTFTTVVATAATNAAANAVALMDVKLFFTAVGNGGAFYAVGMQAFGAQGTATMSPVALASTSINTSLAITMEATDTQSAASTGNVAQLIELDVTRQRK